MRRLKFSDKWIHWIMNCVESTSVSVLVNESPYEEFRIGKGLRQGDLLAPFLFLIVAEGLNGLLSRDVNTGKFERFTFGGNHELMISMFQFADDTIFVGNAAGQNVSVLMCVLR